MGQRHSGTLWGSLTPRSGHSSHPQRCECGHLGRSPPWPVWDPSGGSRRAKHSHDAAAGPGQRGACVRGAGRFLRLPPPSASSSGAPVPSEANEEVQVSWLPAFLCVSSRPPEDAGRRGRRWLPGQPQARE
uniref:Uncharacterized protein n=1 Tax=Molossus molossus TaxID=27622 RepID=A0A7J8DBS8_MOLMO|nr:hypothetical protein HJG59_009310 [Molossus molossus]